MSMHQEHINCKIDTKVCKSTTLEHWKYLEDVYPAVIWKIKAFLHITEKDILKSKNKDLDDKS